MPDISRITLPSGSVYNLKDAEARSQIATLSNATHWLGTTTTVLTDGSNAAVVVVNGENVNAASGDIVSYSSKEFIFNGTVWQEFGSTGALKALAFKDNASADYTPAGSVAAPVISVATAGTTTVVNSITAVGTLPALSLTVNEENLTVAFDAGALPTKGEDTTVKTGDAAYSATAPAFTGTQATITVS